MNAMRDLERDLTRWMAAEAPSRAPEHLAPSVVARTGSMRPRPAWLARLMERPMQTELSLRRGIGLGRSPRLILVGLVMLALLAGAIVVGSRLLQPRLPTPFGPAGNGLLAVDAGGVISLMRPDGSGAQALALPLPGVKDPAFSKDGTKVAAWATPDPKRPAERSLVIANVDGSGATTVIAGLYGADNLSQIAWSPDGARIAFSDTTDRIYLVDIAARSAARYAPDASMLARRDPAWAPDGRLAYRCLAADGVLHLCVTTPDLATERILPTSGGTDFAFQHSAWSHDGRFIAYYVDDVIDHPATAPGFDVATIEVATGTERILSEGTAEHMIIPSWTPDDRYIVVIGAVVAADGSGVRLLGDTCGATEPSPDGRFVACVADGQTLQVWPIDGGAATIIPLNGRSSGLSWQRVAN